MALSLVFASSAAAQRTVVAVGHLVDADTGLPIEGASVELTDRAYVSISDSAGVFRIDSVTTGPHIIRVRHIAYGEHVREVDIRQDQRIELRLSPRALELSTVIVRAPPSPRTERSNVVTRSQIESMVGRARHIGDVVRATIPGATVSEARGGYLCLEFRGGASSRTTGCNYPLVVVDGLPLAEAGRFLRDLHISDIERIEFVPASEGSARYGMGATYGVLVIETRRSGIVVESRPATRSGYPSYSWASEPGGHPGRRAFIGATIGAASGAALALAAIGCFPGSTGAGGPCIETAGAAAGLSALVLPVFGSSFGARLRGATDASRGRLLPSLVMSLFPAALGYGLYLEGVKADFGAQRALGGTLVLVGTPLVATLADYLFRSSK